ncbi:Ldh family oxidoreductase [Luteolibacter sp. GHJ8]|uniref:Ldh family oxidoreductase n=1 Tax=Luteolibacter rhizosphaerae TaxID=2989719 RepID=A0ABT3G8W2_9BACT|nr:Ldh family oxidoreductase [Luteolibacter rhizosphaerae]MCW1916067.1 Ldh family oxidoreductase [Luteolibacter rhizosphaerae]
MSDFLTVSRTAHDQLVEAAYRSRGYTADEAAEGAKLAAEAARHGIRTHHALKALHLDHLFGSATGGCVPGAEIEVVESRFAASETWNAHRKLGQSVAYRAIERCIELADKYGIGQVSVDNAFHYLWGGGYVMDAAERGYIAYTNCTSTLAEVVPFGGKFPTLGTNPHSWGFPTTEALGFPVVSDWATSTVAMGRVQALKREGKQLPPGAAVDKDGNPTTDPNEVVALLPFGAHKGYAMCLINELYGSLIGGSLPTLRGRAEKAPAGEKTTAAFYFQVIHPDAISGRNFANGRGQMENLATVLKDIFGHGNESCVLPGQFEAEARKRSDAAGGLHFTEAELTEFNDLAKELGIAGLEPI